MKGMSRDPERAEVRYVLRYVPIKGARVLEIGGGEGRLTRRIAAVAAAVESIDPNAEAVSRARRLMPTRLRGRVRFSVASGESLRYDNERFDVAVLSWSL
jgi:ubiquinone/menaquinone biosynthesis C-methylase UbiE